LITSISDLLELHVSRNTLHASGFKALSNTFSIDEQYRSERPTQTPGSTHVQRVTCYV